MPSSPPESLDIERLLGDLHRKKRWLDTVIEGLEQAMRSPEVQLINAVGTVLKDGSGPRVDLADGEALHLRVLAARVPRRGLAIEKRRAAKSKEAA
jgi:hypothetical protein